MKGCSIPAAPPAGDTAALACADAATTTATAAGADVAATSADVDAAATAADVDAATTTNYKLLSIHSSSRSWCQ
jgi:hypothetical protein